MTAAFFALAILATIGIGQPAAHAAWPDCNWQCPANDLVAQRLYIADANGNMLPPCTMGNSVAAWLWAELVATSSGTRGPIVVFGDLYVNGSFFQSVDACGVDHNGATITITSTGTYQVRLIPLSYTCGDTVELKAAPGTDAVMAWDTSGDDCADVANRACNTFPNAKCYAGDTLLVEPPPFVRLEITKTDSPDPVKPGDLLTYTITYSNSGTQTATNVVVTETYDADCKSRAIRLR